MKRCSRCGELKPFSAFNRNRTNPDGLQRWCCDCRQAQARAAYQRDRETHLQKNAQYRERNREALRVRSRNWLKNHPEQIKTHQRKSKTVRKSAIDQYNAAYRATHRDQHKQTNLAWYQRNKERYRDYVHRRRACILSARADTISAWAVFRRNDWICQICGQPVSPKEKHPSPLSPTIDHVIPLSRGGTHTWDNVQLAHLNCNKQKFIKFPKEVQTWKQS